MSHYFCQRQPQVPPRPIVLVQRRPDLLQTAQRRGACLHSLLFTVFRSVFFYQTAFCPFAVNKDLKNLHNHSPSSCRELAAALTRTPPAAKIRLTAVHTVGQRFSPFETSKLSITSQRALTTTSRFDLWREGRAMPGRFLQPPTCPDGAQGAKKLGSSWNLSFSLIWWFAIESNQQIGDKTPGSTG